MDSSMKKALETEGDSMQKTSEPLDVAGPSTSSSSKADEAQPHSSHKRSDRRGESSRRKSKKHKSRSRRKSSSDHRDSRGHSIGKVRMPKKRSPTSEQVLKKIFCSTIFRNGRDTEAALELKRKKELKKRSHKTAKRLERKRSSKSDGKH